MIEDELGLLWTISFSNDGVKRGLDPRIVHWWMKEKI